MVTGMLALFTGVALLVLRPDILATYHYNQYVIAATHLFVLGWICTIVMGAMYQLVPVALETRLYSEKLVAWQFMFHLVGFAGMVWMFWTWDMKQVGHFGAVLTVGVGLFVYSGYAVDDSTPNRQYWELWPKIIRKTNWSSMSGSRPTRPAGSISNDFGGRRVLCVRGASRVRRGEMDGGGRCVRGVSIRFPPRPGPFSKTPARLCACGSGRLGQ
jgi:hypothetical protein